MSASATKSAHAVEGFPKICKQYAAHLPHKQLAEAAQLQLAQCLTEQGAHQRAISHWGRVLRSEFWGHNVAVLQQAVPFLLQHGQLQLVLRSLQEPLSCVQCPQSKTLLDIAGDDWDSSQREQFASVLLSIAQVIESEQHASLQHRILHKLYVEFAETSATQQALTAAFSLPWQQQVTIAQRLQRARVLVKRHHHARAEQLLHTLVLPLENKPSVFACEVHYLLGKLARQQRQYDKALGVFAQLGSCPQPFARNASYLSLRIHSFRPSLKTLPQFDAFVQRYPKHAFSDDVLWWKAGILLELKKLKQADATLLQLLRQFPEGDMVPKARFAAAFEQARAGQHRLALQRFEAIRKNRQVSVLRQDQATYWTGRLLLYPDLMSLQPNPLVKSRQRGAELLIALAAQRPTTYHGYLARRVVQYARTAGHVKSQERFRLPVVLTKENGQLKPPKKVLQHKKLLQMQHWIQAGYSTQVSLFLQSFSRHGARRYLNSEADWLWAAYLLHQAGNLPKSHQLMRAWGKAIPPGPFNQDSLLMWQLVHPNAYGAIMHKAAASRGLPVELLQAIAWQESMLDAKVISWAGAIGLCQFIPSTAKQVAKSIGLAPPTVEQLLNPELNARLAANHFMDLMEQLWHPALAIAAYNRGEPALKRWLKKWPPAAPLDAFVASIPTDQTRHYVWHVVGAWVAYDALKGSKCPLYFPLMLPEVTSTSVASH
ncbi:MAG: transglycosylase SLT domain-containing protein [Myxococcota bacterium]